MKGRNSNLLCRKIDTRWYSSLTFGVKHPVWFRRGRNVNVGGSFSIWNVDCVGLTYFLRINTLDVFKLYSHLSFLWILWFLLHSQKTVYYRSVLPYCHPYREGDQPSKKALKKQQKQEEKAKRKAETQARLVGASHVCRGKIDSQVAHVHTVPLEVVASSTVACGPACITHHLSTYYCAHLCISSSTWHIACPFLSLCMSPAGGWGRSKSRRGKSHSHGLTVRACCRVAS